MEILFPFSEQFPQFHIRVKRKWRQKTKESLRNFDLGFNIDFEISLFQKWCFPVFRKKYLRKIKFWMRKSTNLRKFGKNF